MIRFRMIEFRNRLLCSVVDAGAGAGAGGGAGAGSGGSGAGADPGKGGGAGAGAGAGAGGPWYGTLGLDAEATQWIEGHKFDGGAALVKTARHFEEVSRSRDVIKKPDPAKLAEWEGWKDLGWEPDAAKYAIKPPTVKEGIVFDAALHDGFRKAAHELRVPQAAAEQLFNRTWDAMMGKLDAATSAGAANRVKLEGELKAEWGGEYARNRELAVRAAKWAGIGLDDKAELEKFLGSPGLVKAFAKIGAARGEDKLGGPGGDTSLPDSPKAIEAELNRLENDPEFVKVLNDQRDPRYADFTDKRRKLIHRLGAAQTAASNARAA